MMEAEKVKPLGVSCEVHDPGLLPMEAQPDRIQDRPQPRASSARSRVAHRW